jgi:hypothetical protein
VSSSVNRTLNAKSPGFLHFCIAASAPAHPPTEDHDDTVEAHYACLESLRPCACISGVVYIGHLAEADREQVEVVDAVPCPRCADR